MKKNMRKYILAYFVLFGASFFGCSNFAGSKSKLVAAEITKSGITGYYENISPRMVKEMMDSGETFTLADVRTEKEYKSGHLKGAKHFPIDKFDSWYNKLNRDDKIVLYCLGAVRSADASKRLVKKGFNSIYNMEGGIADWKYETFK